ncbi:MAG TPA: alpha/beta fold hydrolase [Candidatus Rubrimentiphilum sp.]|nr:alpha/beta fold hydrolase [Candidatus Rubrimentiphilum sp.]
MFAVTVALLTTMTATTVPFTLFDHRIMATATIAGKPFAMIVDTGAQGIIVTPEVARQLHLPQRANAAISGAGARTLRSARTQPPRISLAGRELRTRDAIVADLGPIRRALHFKRLDGIIGLDALTPYVGINIDAHALTLSTIPIAAPHDAHVVPYTSNDGLLRVEAAVDGVHGTFVVDTGDRSALTLFAQFAGRNGFYQMTPRRNDLITGYGLGGPIRGDIIAAHLEVFGFDLPDVVARMPVGHAGVFSTSRDPGSIGNAVLERFNSVYDTVARTMKVWPSRVFRETQTLDAPSPAPLPRHALFGAVLAEKDGKVIVTRAIADGAAARSGIEAGDIVDSLAGQPTPSVSEFLWQVHALHAGDRVPVAIHRDGIAKTLYATMAAPFDEADPDVTTIYRSIEVDGSQRRTLLSMPKTGSEKLPAMLFLGGIGCFSVDVAANPQDPYLRLAHDVAKAGFLTMRVEKSGVGDSQGPPCSSVDFESEERAYAAAIEALKKDPRVDPSRIVLFGHSIGTVEAPQLAWRYHLAGIIVSEAVGRDWPEYEVRNLRRQLELGGEAPAEVDAALLGKQRCLVRLLLEQEPEDVIEQTEPDCKVHNGVYPVSVSYMRQVAVQPIIDTWTRLDLPVLAIWGSSDFVTELPDHERIVDIINARHPGSATLREIEGMDHLLFLAPTLNAAMRAFSSGAPRTYDAQLSLAVMEWLRRFR